MKSVGLYFGWNSNSFVKWMNHKKVNCNFPYIQTVFTLAPFGRCPYLPSPKKRKRIGKNIKGNYNTLLTTGCTRSRIYVTISSINFLQRALAIRSWKVVFHSLILRSTQSSILSMAAFCNFCFYKKYQVGVNS